MPDNHRPALALTLVAAGALAGCGPRGPEAIVAETPLAYRVPAPNPVSYVFGDTASFVIEAEAMGTVRIRSGQEGRAALTFRDTPDGLRVEVSFPRLEATFATEAQGEERADESEMEGPVVVDLAPSGRLVVVDTPSMGPALSEMVGPESLVRPLFVHLPARPVEPGASWTDTVVVREVNGGTTSVGRSVVTTTLVGDTVVDERWVLHLRTASENTVTVTGLSGGVEIEQKLEGVLRGEVFWDPEASLLVGRTEEGELSGTLRMPGITVRSLPVTGSVRRAVRLEPSPTPDP